MIRKRKIIKWSLIALVSVIILTAGFGYWFMSLLPPKDPAAANLEQTTTYHMYLKIILQTVVKFWL